MQQLLGDKPTTPMVHSWENSSSSGYLPRYVWTHLHTWHWKPRRYHSAHRQDNGSGDAINIQCPHVYWVRTFETRGCRAEDVDPNPKGSVTDWNLVCLLEILESGIFRKTLYNFEYFRILYLKIFQLHWNLIWNLKLPRISNKDSKDSESCMLFYYFVLDPLPNP